MRMYVLVLDFDGIITDLNINWSIVRSEISRTVGFKVDSMIAFWDNYFGTELFDLANDIVEKYELKAALNSTPHDDVKQALESFNGIAYLASMQSEKTVVFFLDKHDLKEYFKEILGRNRFGSKARQLQYIRANEGGCKEILVVDDSRRNIESCRKLGLSCILLNRKGGKNLLDIIRNKKTV